MYMVLSSFFHMFVAIGGRITIPTIDHVPWLLGQEFITLADSSVGMTCSTVVGLKPVQTH